LPYDADLVSAIRLHDSGRWRTDAAIIAPQENP
jgi:hypothetical protein